LTKHPNHIGQYLDGKLGLQASWDLRISFGGHLNLRLVVLFSKSRKVLPTFINFIFISKQTLKEIQFFIVANNCIEV